MLNSCTEVPKLLLRLFYKICRTARYYLCGEIDLSGRDSNTANKEFTAKWDLFSIFAGRGPHEGFVIGKYQEKQTRSNEAQ